MSGYLQQFSGYVLAGGRSRRMGRDKAFLTIGDKSFAENSISILSSVCKNRVKFVVNADQATFLKRFPAGSETIFDTYKNRGPVGGIHAALRDCKIKFAIVIAVDLPFIQPTLIEELAQQAFKTNNSVVAVSEDGRIPLCCTFKKGNKIDAALAKFSRDKNTSFLRFLSFIEPEKFQIASNAELFNVNYPEDFERIQAL
ncbi:MAG: molybdenum cofactor guanylyltransferase [Pyrinomonadaceae bacterium]